MVDNVGQRKRRTALRKHSRREREARVGTGELDPDLDFVCPFCHGISSGKTRNDNFQLMIDYESGMTGNAVTKQLFN